MGWIRKALTRRMQAGRGRTQFIEVEPSENLVLLVKFSMATVGTFCGLEVLHVIYLGKWNSEIFAATSALAGTVAGIFVGKKT